MTIPGFTYVANFLTPQEQERLLSAVQGLQFQHDRFRGQQLKRSYAQFGCAYTSTGRKLQSAPAFPPFLTDLIAKVTSHAPAGAIFNQCIITHYPSGAGIGWHTDAPRDRKSTRLNSSHGKLSRMPSSA